MIKPFDKIEPVFNIDDKTNNLLITPNIKNEDISVYQKFMDEWNIMRRKRK